MDKQTYQYISQQTNDPIVERKTCRRTGEDFPIYKSERDILDDISPTINGKKYDLNTPSLSPKARQISRMLYRNDRIFYKGKSAVSNKGLISIYHPGYKGIVYEVGERYEDFRDPMTYGKDTDYKNIWKTINDMMLEVPRINVDGIGNTNSDYCNYCGYCKNCYMDIAGENNEACYYCLFTKYSTRCLDCTFVYDSEYCYETISSYRCNKVVYSQYIENSHNCYFSHDLKNCNNCLRCWNLRNQDYCIFNKKVSKEKFNEILDTVINGTYSGYIKGISTYNKIKSNFIKPNTFNINTQNTYGNNLKDIKNSKFLFNVSEAEDSLYLYDALHAKKCLDINYSLYNPEYSYQLMSTLELKKSVCNFATHHSSFVYYSQLCNNSNHLFGCIGLSNKEYCIFNKQYTKEEYFNELEKILSELILNGKRGEFFPPELSPHPYNDTIAQEYFPIKGIKTSENGEIQILNEDGIGIVTLLNSDQEISDAILDLGGIEKLKIKRRTKNQDVNVPEGMNILKSNEIPDIVGDDDLIQKAIFDVGNKRAFRIVKPEFDFYKNIKLPIPHIHPDIRHTDRIKRRPNRNLYLRQCDKCSIEMISVYKNNPNVYCQDCYNKEIY